MSEWKDIISQSNPMERAQLPFAWAKYYEDFDDNPEKYKKVFQIIEDKIHIKFNIYHLVFIQKVAFFSKTRYLYAIDIIKESFMKVNEREMFPPEINMLRFTLMYVSCLRQAYEQNEWANYPIYVFEQIAEAVIDVWPSFFKGLNVNIIEKTW